MRKKIHEPEIKFDIIERADLPAIIRERNKVPETLRTSYMLNIDMQEEYYEKVLSNRASNTRYFKFLLDGRMIGYGGIENIQWENSTGEISILIFQGNRGHGYGEQCVKSILEYGFNFLNLHSIWGECYYCGNLKFWQKIIDKMSYVVRTATLYDRKYYNGIYHDSLYFCISKEVNDDIKRR